MRHRTVGRAEARTHIYTPHRPLHATALTLLNDRILFAILSISSSQSFPKSVLEAKMFTSLKLAVAALAATAIAQSAIVTGPESTTLAVSAGTGTAMLPSSATTISAYVGGGVSAASVVSANACSTLLAISCDDEDVSELVCSQAKELGAGTVTLTAHPYGFEAVETISTRGAVATFSAQCRFQGTSPSFTAEVCTASVGLSADGQQTATQTAVTSTTAITPVALTITGGAEKLPTGSQSCTSTPGAAMPTAAIEVYKVLVPVGAAVAAGLAVF